MIYPEELVLPMKEELIDNGFENLDTSEKVNEFIQRPGVGFIVINSVCGCAAGSARPAAILAISEAEHKPNNTGTVFAGFDVDAVKTVRDHLVPFPPSSPSMAIFKDGELVHMLERRHIEGFSGDAIAQNLVAAFDEYCEA